MGKKRRKFLSPFEDVAENNGQRFEIIRKLTADEVDDEVGEMFKIKLATGKIIDAYPEEIFSAQPAPNGLLINKGGGKK